MSKQQDKNFVSDLDKFLQAWDEQHPELSASQQKEIKKHKRVQQLRDHITAADEEHKIWENF